MKLFPILVSIVCLSIGTSCTKDVGQNPDLLPKPIGSCDTVKYSLHIQPIFINNCATSYCHGGSQSPYLSDYNLIKTQVDGGRIKARVIDQMTMPPTGALPNAEIALIKCWIENGSPNN